MGVIYGIWLYEGQYWMNDNNGYVLWSKDKSLIEAQWQGIKNSFSGDTPSVQRIRHDGLPPRYETLFKKEKGNAE